ncbi:hypothetical protein GCM10010191_61450 [Actinomadura vinacea]|uniref:AB hydrolase-1 domain-containing protein n=1 Tax=Actinomadura vinacea TaxID=115336 RepID=A0ABN3JR97_9ACTN
MATYVLVPGAHGGWCYQPVARILRQAGHDVHTPTLTGVGERSQLLSNDIDLDFHINDVIQVLTYEDLSNVILAGHSYGGMVITGVARVLSEPRIIWSGTGLATWRDRTLIRRGDLWYLLVTEGGTGPGSASRGRTRPPARGSRTRRTRSCRRHR